MSLFLILVMAATVCAVIYISIDGYYSERDGSWHRCDVYWRKVRSIDGSIINQPCVMRRKVNGDWQYKPATDDEKNEDISGNAI